MAFYNSIYLKSSSDRYVHFDSEIDELQVRLKKAKSNIDGYFDLIVFNQTSIGKFRFKEFLVEEDPGFVKINAIVNNELITGFLDLSSEPILLDLIKLIPQDERAKQVNEYAINYLKIKPKLIETTEIFRDLGVDDPEDQRTIMSFDYKDISRLSDLFDKIFPGINISQKIEFYKQKSIELENSYEYLSIINKIFIPVLVVKIFKDEVLIDEVSSFNFVEFEISNQAKADLAEANQIAVLKDCRLLINFLSLVSSENLKLLIQIASFYGKEDVVLELISKSPEGLKLAIFGASLGGKIEIIKKFLLDGVCFSAEDIKKCIEVAIQQGREDIVIEFLSKSPEYISTVFFEAITSDKQKLVSNIFEEYRNFISIEDIQNAIEVATKNKNDFIVDYLLLKKQEKLGLEVFNAVLSDKIDLIKSLLSDGVNINHIYLRDSIEVAIQKGFISIVDYLLLKSPENLGLAYVNGVLYRESRLINKFFSTEEKEKLKNFRDHITQSNKYFYEDIINYLVIKKVASLKDAVLATIFCDRKDLFKILLSELTVSYPEWLGEIVNVSINQDNKFIVSMILCKYPLILNKVFNKAVVLNKESVVKCVLSKYHNVLSKDLEKVFEIVVKAENITMIDCLLSVSPSSLGLFVVSAMCYEKENLLESNSLSNCLYYGDLRKHIESLIQQKRESLILNFLSKQPKYLHLCFYSAVNFYRKKLVLFILSKFKNNSESDLNNAIKWLINFRNLSSFNFVLSENSEYLKLAMINAVILNKVSLIRSIFLEHKSISFEDIKKCIEVAIQQGSQAVFLELLSKYDVTLYEDLKKFTELAVKIGDKFMTNTLISKFPKCLDIAIVSVFLYGKESLFEDISVNYNDLKKSLKAVIEQGSESLILDLLSKKPKFLSLIFHFAVVSNKEGLVSNIFSRYGDILDKDIKKAIEIARSKGYEHIVSYLLSKSSVSGRSI